MRRYEEYRALEAWEQMLGSPQWMITALQKGAARENAPVDCVFKVGLNQWHLLSECRNPETRKYLMEHHPELFQKHK